MSLRGTLVQLYLLMLLSNIVLGVANVLVATVLVAELRILARQQLIVSA